MKFLTKVLPLLALLALSDLHWGIMQVAAWVEMTADSVAKNESVVTSVYQSVTGEKKCARCCQIEQGQKEENENSVQWESKTLGLNLGKAHGVFPPPALYEPIIFEHESALHRSYRPITPPPWS